MVQDEGTKTETWARQANLSRRQRLVRRPNWMSRAICRRRNGESAVAGRPGSPARESEHDSWPDEVPERPQQVGHLQGRDAEGEAVLRVRGSLESGSLSAEQALKNEAHEMSTDWHRELQDAHNRTEMRCSGSLNVRVEPDGRRELKV